MITMAAVRWIPFVEEPSGVLLRWKFLTKMFSVLPACYQQILLSVSNQIDLLHRTFKNISIVEQKYKFSILIFLLSKSLTLFQNFV